MKLPRDLSGEELTKALARLGYGVTRQTGSHLRLTYSAQGKVHHITIPRHKVLKVGTLHHILRDVAQNLGMTWEALLQEIFE